MKELENVFLEKKEVFKIMIFVDKIFEVKIEKRIVEESEGVFRERVFLQVKYEKVVLGGKLEVIRLFIMGVKLFVFLCDRVVIEMIF